MKVWLCWLARLMIEEEEKKSGRTKTGQKRPIGTPVGLRGLEEDLRSKGQAAAGEEREAPGSVCARRKSCRAR